MVRYVGLRNWGMFKPVAGLGLILMLAFGLKAYAAAPYIGWNEEVLLHDGSKLVLYVAQRHGGRHRIDQPVPVSEQVISFSIPGSSDAIRWSSRYGPILIENLRLLAVDVVGQVAYIVTAPVGKGMAVWNNPNPPYVFFKYDGKKWQRIPIEDFPAEIKEANVVIDTLRYEGRLTAGKDVITADQVKAMNDEMKGSFPPYWLVFNRTPLEKAKHKPADAGDSED